jgi:hypothetical protein
MLTPLIAHVEIPSTNLERTAEFLQKLLNWDFKPFGRGYLLFNNHKGIMVGLRKADKIIAGDSTVFHINIENIEAVLKRVEGLGGKVKRNKTVIPAMGWYALITDPDGNTIGLFQKS